MKKHSAVCVLTARGVERILCEGGSQAWVLDAKRAHDCEYVVCIQNRGSHDDWGQASADHHSAFVVGRLKDVTKSVEVGSEERWMLTFREYAEINIPDAWPGNRNPVFYTDLEAFGIDVTQLKFEKLPSNEAMAAPASAKTTPLTIAQAKAGLAMMFDIEPDNIEITIRG